MIKSSKLTDHKDINDYILISNATILQQNESFNHRSMKWRSDYKTQKLEKWFFTVSKLTDMQKETTDCPSCTIKINYKQKNGNIRADSPKLEAFNKDLGYVQNNVNIICNRCATVKKHLSLETMEKILLKKLDIKTKFTLKEIEDVYLWMKIYIQDHDNNTKPIKPYIVRYNEKLGKYTTT